MADELSGEHLTVVRWDDSPERFIQNAFGGHPAPEVALDEATHTAFVTAVEPNPHAPDRDLLGELAGWNVRLRGGGSK
jgi:transcription antitermination factor NusA-like protein